MKIKTGDNIVVISGKDKGRKGKVLEVHSATARIIVEGLNLKKKHRRPRKSGEKGQTVEIASSFHASNAKLICPKCSQATRVGIRVAGKNKFRICKKCKQEV